MIFRGSKVILRPLQLTDAARFVKWLNDPSVNKFLRVRRIILPDEKKWIAQKKHSQTDRIFAIDTTAGVHIGSVGLHQIDVPNRRCNLGIMIGDRRYWDKGFGTEAISLLLDYGFRKLKMHRIELDVYAYNRRAIKVYRRLGFKREGKKREHNFWGGRFWDTYHMAVLDREWEKNKKLNSSYY